jgi:hypothetical protein
MLSSVAILRLGGDTIAPRPEIVRCAACACELGEDEAQAVRWGWSSNGVADMYPFCEPCAASEFRIRLVTTSSLVWQQTDSSR